MTVLVKRDKHQKKKTQALEDIDMVSKEADDLIVLLTSTLP